MKPQTICPGWRGKPCPTKARPPARAFQSDRVRRRNGRPWRCQPCSLKPVGEKKRGAAHWWTNVSKCPKGHAYTKANTIVYTQPGKRARRYCRECRLWRDKMRWRILAIEHQLWRLANSAIVRLGLSAKAIGQRATLEAKLHALRRQYPGRNGHPNGQKVKLRLPCAICGRPAAPASSRLSRRLAAKRRKAYCGRHDPSRHQASQAVA